MWYFSKEDGVNVPEGGNSTCKALSKLPFKYILGLPFYIHIHIHIHIYVLVVFLIWEQNPARIIRPTYNIHTALNNQHLTYHSFFQEARIEFIWMFLPQRIF
jgi:hypothetical protein